MNLQTWLDQSIKKLEQAGIDTARLDSLVLLEDTLLISKASILANGDKVLSTEQIAKLEKLLNTRLTHLPLAYVRGHSEFYGREFVVTNAVLEPRPESETMIELFKGLIKDRENNLIKSSIVKVADVGSGSGALGITAAIESPESIVDLLEIDTDAINVSKINVDKFTLKLNVIKSDLISNTPGNYLILLCNLPYVPNDFKLNLAATHEPKIAIFGGQDGLDLYRSLFNQIDKLENKPLYILTESLPGQHAMLVDIANNSGYREYLKDDFIQVFEKH